MAHIQKFKPSKKRETPEKVVDFHHHFLVLSGIIEIFLSEELEKFLFIIINFKDGRTEDIQLTLIPNNFKQQTFIDIRYNLQEKIYEEFLKDDPNTFVNVQILQSNKITNKYLLFSSIADIILHCDEFFFIVLYSIMKNQEIINYYERYFDNKNEKLSRCDSILEKISAH